MHKHIGEENIAAILIEPIQGEGGFIVPAPGFIAGLAEFAAANGIVFIADEIQSGWAVPAVGSRSRTRASSPTSSSRAKSLGGGLPISAITGRAELMDSVHVGGLGGTYGGNPVAAAAALAVLDKIEREGLLERSRAVGETIGDVSRASRIGSARSATCAAAGRCARSSSSPTAPPRSRSTPRR